MVGNGTFYTEREAFEPPERAHDREHAKNKYTVLDLFREAAGPKYQVVDQMSCHQHREIKCGELVMDT